MQPDEITTKAELNWIKVKFDWNNESLHQQFIEYCSQNNLLHIAAKKYKEYQTTHGSSPLLEKYLTQILTLAQFKLSPTSKQNKKPGFTSKIFTWWNLCFILGPLELIYSLISKQFTIHFLFGLTLLGTGIYLSFRNFSRTFSGKD